MKFLTLSIVLLFYVEKTFAGSFVDSIAKEYGKENGCYSIALSDKKDKKSYTKSFNNKNLQKFKKTR